MQSLQTITVPNSETLSLARVTGEYEDPIRRYVFSTRETRDIVNKPEVMGVAYTELLEQGIVHLLEGVSSLHFDDIDEEQVNVFHYLRGSLNFGIRNALHRAYGWNTHGASFMSSQRARDEEGRWYITEDSYRKLTMAKGSIVYCGDVVATGVTLESGLDALTKALVSSGGSIRYFVFFTIGCHKTEKIFEKYYKIWKETFSDFEGIDVYYIEGKFHLADSKTPVTIKLPGTDLLRRDSLLMPEFIEALQQDLPAALERCTIYDAGSRAFDVQEYKEDVMEYWQQVSGLAQDGMTTAQYLEERFPECSESLRSMAKETDLFDLCSKRISLLS